MADFGFDGPTLRAIEPAGAGDFSQFDFARDVYSAWKRWAVQGDNLKYGPFYSVEGGTPIGATALATGLTIVQDAEVFIRPDERNHVLSLVGPEGVDANCYSGGGRLSTLTLGSFNTEVTVTNAAAAQRVITPVSGLQPDERAAILQNTDDLSAIRTDVDQIQIDLASVQGDIATINGNIATIQTDTGQIQIDISALEGDVDYIYQMERGKWEIDDQPGPTFGQMVFYAPDGVTPIRTFQLQDAGGNPVAVDPVRRVPL